MFSKFELTNKGVELLNRVIAEQKTLKFTKFKIGKGDFSGDKKTLTQLVSKIDEFNVSQTNVLADGITNIKGFYDNRNLSVASKLTEIGIMAQLGDDNLTEVLFSYSNQPSAEAETIPSKESYFSRTFSVMNRTDNVTSVTFDLTIRQDKYNFGTLAEMKAADYLDVGDKVTLWGNAALGDSSFKMYIITDQAQPIQLNNKLYAKEYFAIVNDLTTGGADKALSGEMGKKLNNDKQDKTDNELQTDSKEIVPAINEGLWRNFYNEDTQPPQDNLLKNFIKAARYSLASPATNAIKFSDAPISDTLGSSLLLDVITPVGKTGATTFLQKIYNRYNAEEYIRNVQSGVAREWKRFITDHSLDYLGQMGIPNIRYIQDAGTKTRGQGYIDKDTGKLYKCVTEKTDDVTVTSKFELADNISLSEKIKNLFTREMLWNAKSPSEYFNQGTLTIPNLNEWYMVVVDTVNYASEKVNVQDNKVVINPDNGVTHIDAFDFDSDQTFTIDFGENKITNTFSSGVGTYNNNYIVRVVGCIKKPL